MVSNYESLNIEWIFQTLVDLFDKNIVHNNIGGKCLKKEIYNLKKVVNLYIKSEIQLNTFKVLNTNLSVLYKDDIIHNLKRNLENGHQRIAHLEKEIDNNNKKHVLEIHSIKDKYANELKTNSILQTKINDLQCHNEFIQEENELKIKEIDIMTKSRISHEKSKLIDTTTDYENIITKLNDSIEELKKSNGNHIKENSVLKQKISSFEEQIKKHDQKDYDLIKKCLPHATSANNILANFSTVATVSKSIKKSTTTKSTKRKLYNPKFNDW